MQNIDANILTDILPPHYVEDRIIISTGAERACQNTQPFGVSQCLSHVSIFSGWGLNLSSPCLSSADRTLVVHCPAHGALSVFARINV